MSTTFEGLILRNSTIAKNIIENITGLTPFPNTGCIPTSNVVAAVLGIAKNGPIQRIDAVPITNPNFLPALPYRASKSPPVPVMAITPSKARPPSANRNAINPKNHLVPSSTRSEEHTSELQSRQYLVCRLLLEKKKK